MACTNAAGTCANACTCTACGTAGASLKTCSGCKKAEYCSRDCQLSHWKAHKSECKRRVAEAASWEKLSKQPLPTDEELFQQPDYDEDCPICFMRFPLEPIGKSYMPCCGKLLCAGCVLDGSAIMETQICPFCRAEAHSDEERIEMYKRRMEVNDEQAFYCLAMQYWGGSCYGVQRNMNKGLELLFRAAELGCMDAHSNIGTLYILGKGLEEDAQKAERHLQIAAMGGEAQARHNLGILENGHYENVGRALKHWMIAAKAGYDGSLQNVRDHFLKGLVSKEDYELCLRAHKASTDEMANIKRKEIDEQEIDLAFSTL